MLKKCVTANRGEIARRVLRAAKERGYLVAVIATEDDMQSLVCQEADAVLPVQSFLDVDDIVAQTKKWGAHLLHPGYGFLSENANFAQKVEDSGILFVGPTSDNMRLMGSKEAAKINAQHCQVPTLNALFSAEFEKIPRTNWLSELEKRHIHSPYLVKASGGGGGRGMRVVRAFSELADAIERASQEALASFHDGTVFVEPYLVDPRHIEIQVFGDGQGGGVFFGERECSLQRRHQKVIEEAPSPIMTPQLREKMGQASLALVRHTKYRGAGTLEFLFDTQLNFYFLEMNTRLQVEHPVTELVYGIDLVHAQFDLALGKWPVSFPSPNEFSTPTPCGVALEARILAEDPRHQFLPTPGAIIFYQAPVGEGVRVDSGVQSGSHINSNFDSMLAKLTVHAPTRPQAVKKLVQALEQFIVHGCTTNLPFLQSIARHYDFLQGNESTAWIADNIDQLNLPLIPSSFVTFFQSAGFREKLSFLISGLAEQPNQLETLFAEQHLESENTNQNYFFTICCQRINQYKVTGLAVTQLFAQLSRQDICFNSALLQSFNQAKLQQSGEIVFFATRVSHSEIQLTAFGERLILSCPRHAIYSGESVLSQSGDIRAPMAGRVYEIFVTEGQQVEESQLLFVVESMKMQLEVKSPRSGTVDRIYVEKGQTIAGTDVIALIKG